MDVTSGFEVYSARVNTRYDFQLDSAGVGVQQDTTGMSACPNSTLHYPAPGGGTGACNDVADFSGVFANGSGGIFGSGYGLANWNAVQVITTGGGLKANAAIVAPDDSITPSSGTGESSLSVFAGEVL
jgi:hypothetical protein